MVAAIENAPTNCLVLIEEIGNRLHPVAARRMVEYLIDTADRRSVQSIFTTHSEDALLPLPREGIWYSIEGKVRQGRTSIEALRALTGRVAGGLAIFVEDDFAKEIFENIVRRRLSHIFDQPYACRVLFLPLGRLRFAGIPTWEGRCYLGRWCRHTGRARQPRSCPVWSSVSPSTTKTTGFVFCRSKPAASVT